MYVLYRLIFLSIFFPFLVVFRGGGGFVVVCISPENFLQFLSQRTQIYGQHAMKDRSRLLSISDLVGGEVSIWTPQLSLLKKSNPNHSVIRQSPLNVSLSD